MTERDAPPYLCPTIGGRSTANSIDTNNLCVGGPCRWACNQQRELRKLSNIGSGGRSRSKIGTKTASHPSHDRSTGRQTRNSLGNRGQTSTEDNTTAPSKATVDDQPLEQDLTGIGEHIIIPYDGFLEFMTAFHCGYCRTPVQKLERSTIGIATRITYNCVNPKCPRYVVLEPETVRPMEGETVDGHWKRRISSYSLNVRLVLLTHLIGGSWQAGLIIGSMLAISSSVFSNAWVALEEKLGISIRKMADKVLEENIEREIEGVEQDEQGYYPVDVSGDGGWQTGGKRHDSLSGHTMVIGKKTDKVLAYTTYAKNCSKCTGALSTGKPAKPHVCPRNYVGSSKGMESCGLLECILKLHHDFGLVIRKFVIDDDATTKAYAKHSIQEKLDAGHIQEWPKTATGNKLRDTGRLPLTHPVIQFIADLNHRVRTFAGALWTLKALGSTVTRLTGAECHRIKRNFSFWLARYCQSTRKEFEERAPAVVQHHFNDHTFCDPVWCKYAQEVDRRAEELELEGERTGKYRSLLDEPELHDQLTNILNDYTSTKFIDEMHHIYTSQQNEAMNRSIMKYAPKIICFSKSSSLSTRIALAVGVNSIGHTNFYNMVFTEIGLYYNYHCESMFLKLDRKFLNAKAHKKKRSVKKKRTYWKNFNWRNEANRRAHDKRQGRSYGRWSTSPATSSKTENSASTPKLLKPNEAGKKCNRCSSIYHLRSNHKDCPFNKNNLTTTTTTTTTTANRGSSSSSSSRTQPLVRSPPITVDASLLQGGVSVSVTPKTTNCEDNSQKNTEQPTIEDRINATDEWDEVSFSSGKSTVLSVRRMSDDV